MEAGRELDAEIARRIFGAKTAIGPDDGRIWLVWGGISGVIPPSPYSTDIGAAWQVIEWLCDQGYAPLVMCHLPLNSGWQASVIRSYDEPMGAEIEADGETAPLAICRLALKVQKHYLSDKASCDKENMVEW